MHFWILLFPKRSCSVTFSFISVLYRYLVLFVKLYIMPCCPSAKCFPNLVLDRRKKYLVIFKLGMFNMIYFCLIQFESPFVDHKNVASRMQSYLLTKIGPVSKTSLNINKKYHIHQQKISYQLLQVILRSL